MRPPSFPLRCFSRLAFTTVLASLSLSAVAACPDDAAVSAYIADFSAQRPSKGFGNDISLADAECAKGKVAKRLQSQMGKIVGYKAGFTSAALQQRFAIDSPKWATMYERNMVDSGAIIPAQFGARPMVEADLVVIVKDAGLAEAKTPLEALEHLETVVPFIELPDLMLEGSVTGNALVATNIAFRGGAYGEDLPVVKSQAFLDALASMTVVMTDEIEGKELGRAQGSALMDNPIKAAMWLAQALKKDGISLQAGDALSLGGFFPPQPARPGVRIQVRYIGLPGDPAVSVELR